MPEEATIYREKLSSVIDIPEPDDLIQATSLASLITLPLGGTYKRGELLMSTGDNEFMTATAAGLSSATEIAILCRDCEIPEGESYETTAYFIGTFNSERIVLSYETETDNHAELIDAIRIALRRHHIYLV